MLRQRADDGPGFRRERRGRAPDPAGTQFAEDVARPGSLLDELELVRIEEMGHEAGVLVHDVVPEGGDLRLVELGFSLAELFQAMRPTLRFVARVVEEQRPDQTAKRAVPLG